MAKRTASKAKRGKATARAKKAAAPARKTARRAVRPAARRAPAKRRKKARAPLSQDAMMALWQTYMTPSAGHQRLEPTVGTFAAKTTVSMDPKAPPDTSEGVSEHRWVLGGRYLEQRYTGTMMGMPFEGIGYTGYDNGRKKYVGTWIDNFGTGVMNSVGTGKVTDGALDFEADATDQAGKPMKLWCKLRIQDGDHHTFEMWTKSPTGRKYRSMLIEYTRQS